jgi:hypothetical protein
MNLFKKLLLSLIVVHSCNNLAAMQINLADYTHQPDGSWTYNNGPHHGQHVHQVAILNQLNQLAPAVVPAVPVVVPYAANAGNNQQEGFWSKLFSSGNAKRLFYCLASVFVLQSINQQTGLCWGTTIDCHVGIRPDFLLTGILGLGLGYLTYPKALQDIKNIFRWFRRNND